MRGEEICMYYCRSHGCSYIQLHQYQSQLTILLNNLLNMLLLSLSNSFPNEIQKLPNIQRYGICYNIYSTRAQYEICLKPVVMQELTVHHLDIATFLIGSSY